MIECLLSKLVTLCDCDLAGYLPGYDELNQAQDFSKTGYGSSPNTGKASGTRMSTSQSSCNLLSLIVHWLCLLHPCPLSSGGFG